MRSAIGEMLVIVRRHRLRVPRDLSLLFTVLIVAEGLVADLDPVNATKLDELILHLRDDLGTTVVLVSHDLPSVFAVADRAA